MLTIKNAEDVVLGDFVTTEDGTGIPSQNKHPCSPLVLDENDNEVLVDLEVFHKPSRNWRKIC